MSTAVITDLAAGVTTLITDASLSQTPAGVTRVYIPNYDIETKPGLQIFVLGMQQAMDVAAGSREHSQDTYTVTVAIYKQVTRDTSGQIDQTEMDANIYFVQQVIDLLKANNNTATTGNQGSLVAIKNQPVYDPAALDTTGTFCSVLSLDYLLFR